jgi:hypothetical protein
MCGYEKDHSNEKLGKEEEEWSGSGLENPFIPAFREDRARSAKLVIL